MKTSERFLRLNIFALLLLGLLVPSLRAQWTTNEIDIDGTPIKLVFPSEYLKAPEDDGALVQSRRILKDYLVFANYKSGKEWQFVQVQMHNSQRSYRYTRESFMAGIAATKAELPNFDKREIRDQMNKRLDEIATGEIRLSNPVLFPISDESDRHFIMPILMGIDLGSDVKDRTVVAAAMITISLKGRVVMLQVYTPYEDKNSINRVSALGKEIAQRTLAENR